MSVSAIDDLWFRAHPGRAYRLRSIPPREAAGWPVPPPEGYRACCIVRRSDGASERGAIREPEAFDDFDDELAAVFDQLRHETA